MTSLESTGVVRPARPDEASSSRSRDAESKERGASPAGLATRTSPDPLVATDRYRLTQPYTRRI